MNILYHFNRCSKSRQALALLEEQYVEFKIRYYIDQPLSRDEILSLQKKLNIPLIEMIRTQENIFKELFPSSTFSDEELIQALIAHPSLMQRPIFEKDDQAVVARPPEKILDLI